MPVRVIRFILLLAVIVIAFIATPTFALRPFASLLPTDFMADSVPIQQFRQWVTDDLARFSLLLTSCAALTFGLLAAPWPFDATLFMPTGTRSQATAVTDRPRRRRLRWWSGLLLLLVALGGTIGLLFWQQRNGETVLLHLSWVGSSLFFLMAASLLTPQSVLPAQSRVDSVTGAPSTLRYTVGWRALLLLLFLFLLLIGWKVTTAPAVVDDAVAAIGLQGLAMTEGEQPALFSVAPLLSQSDNLVFQVAIVPTALLIWVTGDLLLSTRLIGLLAALLAVGATWLIALELFTRRPTPPGGSTLIAEFTPIEDNDRSAMIVATFLVMIHIALLYYSRQPILLEAMAWGTMGCWALLRGLRTHDRLALALSGLLLGISYLFHGGALTFLLTALLWWVGFGAAQMGLLPHLERTPKAGRLHGGDFLLWLLGFALISAPFLSMRMAELLLWFNQVPTSVGSALMVLLSSFSPPVATYPAPFYNPLLLPLFPLLFGVLLFNFDRRLVWMISSWMGSGLLVAALLQPQGLRWELLLPLIPAIALALAFTLDRLRVTLARVGGRWIQQFLTYFLLGLLLWIGFQNVTTYYSFLLRQRDSISTIGYALRTLPVDQPVLLYLSPESTLVPQFTDATDGELGSVPLPLRFLTNDNLDFKGGRVRFVTALPASIAPATTVIFFPEDPVMAQSGTLDYLRTTYPSGTALVKRDILANPLLILFTVQMSAQTGEQ